MKINGKVFLLFEQSGTFKNEFLRLSIPAEDFDIKNDFGETDHIIDLFNEINNGYECNKSIFDNVQEDDLIMAFFPCIYFSCLSMINFSFNAQIYKKIDDFSKIEKIIERSKYREEYYVLILKLIGICISRNLRLIIENPWSLNHYLKGNFVKKPDIVDYDRSKRGDFFIKPTAYFFFNCKPTNGYTFQQQDKRLIKSVIGNKQQGGRARKSKIKGICSVERSMISKDYARNFICDNIIGREQKIDKQLKLF